MLAEERFREILKIVNEKKTVTVTELTELLDTSESTIRRDLTQLHKRGALLKVHGGATVLNGAYTTKDAKVSEREGLYVEEKRSIAKLAAALIGQEDFVYIDAGTSTASLAEAISEREAVYVTNGILHAKCLAEKGCRVFLPGGELKEDTQALVGGAAVEWLNKYNFNKRLLWHEWNSSGERVYDTGYQRSTGKRSCNEEMQRGICSGRFEQIRSCIIRHICEV